MPIGSQMDGFAHTIGAVIVDHGRQDAAVGGACASSLAERDVAGSVGVVGDDKNKVIACLGRGGNDAVFGGRGGVAATDHLIGSQIGARRGIGDGGIRTPTAEVNVVAWGTVHVYGDAAWVGYSHIIPSRVRL